MGIRSPSAKRSPIFQDRGAECLVLEVASPEGTVLTSLGLGLEDVFFAGRRREEGGRCCFFRSLSFHSQTKTRSRDIERERLVLVGGGVLRGIDSFIVFLKVF